VRVARSLLKSVDAARKYREASQSNDRVIEEGFDYFRILLDCRHMHSCGLRSLILLRHGTGVTMACFKSPLGCSSGLSSGEWLSM
jgi:hypothetical protein